MQSRTGCGKFVLNESDTQTGQKPPLCLIEEYFKVSWWSKSMVILQPLFFLLISDQLMVFRLARHGRGSVKSQNTFNLAFLKVTHRVLLLQTLRGDGRLPTPPNALACAPWPAKSNTYARRAPFMPPQLLPHLLIWQLHDRPLPLLCHHHHG